MFLILDPFHLRSQTHNMEGTGVVDFDMPVPQFGARRIPDIVNWVTNKLRDFSFSNIVWDPATGRGVLNDFDSVHNCHERTGTKFLAIDLLCLYSLFILP